jgi:predicted metal-binding protein
MKPCLGNKKYNYLLVIKQGVGKLRVIQFYKCIADKPQCRIQAEEYRLMVHVLTGEHISESVKHENEQRSTNI